MDGKSRHKDVDIRRELLIVSKERVDGTRRGFSWSKK